MDVLDDRVKSVPQLCEKKKADEFVFVNPKTKKPYTDIKRSFATAFDKAEIRNLEWHDLRATFCIRLAFAVTSLSPSKHADGPSRYEDNGKVYPGS